ncbi:MAG: filamentous hemagglutinin N-terminal domain-containing protein [Pseudomonadaceae bacterium]|nr:filamentous hemagglutinin N-terminal domain-containing protein [Pseudomonadaceae bacterium]
MRTRALFTLTVASGLLWAAHAAALPQNATVTGGQATLTQSGNQLTVTQSTDRAVLNWDSFNLATGEAAHFALPNANSISLNRVTGGGTSLIDGSLTSNGNLYLLNPQGIMFGAGAAVDVGGLLATTATLSDAAFLSGNTFAFTGGTGTVTNHGAITGNNIVLAAPTVENHGTLTANGGHVALAGAGAFTIDPVGDNLLTLSPDPAAFATRVANSGHIHVGDGTATLATQLTEAAYTGVVNMDGMVEATGFTTNGGHIILNGNGGTTQVAGTLAANSNVANGGTVEVLGNFVDIQTGAALTANGATGGGTVLAGGNYQGKGPQPNAAATRVATGTILAANATDNGNGGKVVTWADNTTTFHGTAQARGGANGGNGGLIEVSGKQSLAFNGAADTLAPQGRNGMLLFDPANITITDGGPDADDAEVADGTVADTDGGAGDFLISEQALEALSAGTDITLQATNNITVQDLTDDTLALATTGNVTFTADSDTDGSGSFAMNAGDTVTTGGAGLTITGAGITLGGLNTSAGSGGAIAITANGGAGPIALGGNLTTNNGAITLAGPTTLTADAALTSNGGLLTTTGSLTGAYTLGLNAGSGNITLGGTSNLTGLTFTGGNTLTLQGSHILGSDIDFSALTGLTLAANTTLNAGTNAIITDAANTINGAYTLGLTGGDITLAGTLGGSTPLTTLTTTASGNLTLATTTTSGNQTHTGATITTGGTLTTTGGTLTLTGPVTLGGATTFTATANNVSVANTINGGQALTINTPSGNTNLASIVGGSTPLTSVLLNTSTFTAKGITTGGAQTYTGTGTIQGTFGAGGNVLFNSPVNLTAGTAFTTAGNNVTFASTLNGAQGLTASTGAGQLNLQGAVGGITPLLSIASTGGATITANTTTTGAQSYQALNLDATLTSTGGNIATTGALTLLGDSILNTATAGSNISLGGTTTGSLYNLALNAGTGDLAILGDLTLNTLTLTAADDLTLGAGLTTTNGLDFSSIDDIVLTAASGINTGSNAITMNSGNTISGAFDLDLTGSTIALGPVNGVNNLTLTASTAGNVNYAVSTVGTQTYNGPTTLNADLTTTADDVTLAGATALGADVTIATTGGALDAQSTVDGAHALTATTGTGDITLAGTIGGSTPLTGLNLTTTGALDTQTVTLAGDAILAADTLTLGNTFTGTNLTGTGTTGIDAQTIALTGNLNLNAPALTLNQLVTAQNIDLTGALSSAFPITAGGYLLLTGDSTLGGSLAATTDLTILGNTTLTANSTLTSGGGAADTLTVSGNVDGDYDLTLVAGSGDIALTGNIDTNGLTFASGNTLTYGGGTLEADTGINFGNLSGITLMGDTNIYGRDGASRSNVSSGNNTILAGTTGVDLYVYGNVVTMNQIGDAGAGKLESLTVDAAIAQLLGNIYTVGDQTITAQEGLAGFLLTGGGDIVLNTTANLVGDIFIETSGGDIYINQPLNGAYQMSLNAGTGTANVNAALGDVVPLTNMTITAATINLSQPITTTGNQTYTGETNLNTTLTIAQSDIVYNSPVNLGANGTIDTSGNNGNITFNNTVDGPYNLVLRAGPTGNITFNNTVGETTRVGSLTVESTGNITFNNGLHVQDYYQNRINGLASFGSAPGLDATGGVYIATSNDLTGTFHGRTVSLESDGLISGLVYATESLTLNAAQTILGGTIRGMDGRDAARLIGFGGLTGGPHYFGGLALPLVDDYVPQPNRMAQLFGRAPSVTGAPLGIGGNVLAELNPFTAAPTLLLADDGLIQPIDNQSTTHTTTF